MATLCCLVYRPTYWIASSRFSTLQLGRSPVYVAQITSLTLLPVFTGFVLLSASISNWRSLYTELCTALHLDTCLTFLAALLTCRLVVVYGRRLPANLISAGRIWQLSETVHLALLGQSSGTVSLMTLHRLHRCQVSERNWKLTYFITFIRTLLCSFVWVFCRHRGPSS